MAYYNCFGGTKGKDIASITGGTYGGATTRTTSMITKSALAICNIATGGEGSSIIISSSQAQVYELSTVSPNTSLKDKIYRIEGNIGDTLSVTSACAGTSIVTFIWYE